MAARCSFWLLIVAMGAGCAGGQPPPPLIPATASAAASLPASATPAPTFDFAPATPPDLTAPTAAPLVATPTLTDTPGLITAAIAAGVIEVGRVAAGKADQAAWAPDGKQLAAAGAAGVTLYDAATLSATQTLAIGQWATSLAYDPAGRDLAVGTVGGIVQVWSLARLEPTTLLLGPGVAVARVSYSPAGGALLASLGVDNTAHLWYVDGQQHLRTLGAGARPAYALAFSADGQWLAAAEAGLVRLWDVQLALAFDQPPVRTLAPPARRTGAVTALAFNPAEDQLAVANSAGTIELWDPDALQPELTFTRLNTPAQHLAFNPTGQVLASAHADHSLRLWETSSGRLLLVLAGHTGAVTSLAFSPDGTRLASSSWDATLRLWGLAPSTE